MTLAIFKGAVESLSPRSLLKLNEEYLSKQWIASALHIDYNYKLPIEEYLDIIIPRKEKINNLLNEIANKKSKERYSKDIKDEIWEINSEISNSKRIDTWTFAVNCAHTNWKVVLGMLMGGLIGYTSGNFAGLAIGNSAGIAGTILGGITNKVAEKKGLLKTPKYPKKTIEWIKEKIEGPEETLTARLLAKDLKTIQIWNLRRKLETD